eukprot:m.470714 g.470714  ORF g.470714 m.470714 type:complete len:259 (+) comp30161_c0_seq1:134-910(+)
MNEVLKAAHLARVARSQGRETTVPVGDGRALTLHERPGEAVGGYTWPGGRLLAQFLLSPAGRQAAANGESPTEAGVIVELGCGVGVSGLAVAAGHGANVLLTDRSPECLALASRNALANETLIPGAVAVTPLNWGELTADGVVALLDDPDVVCGKWPARGEGTVAMVIGADVLYTVDSIEPLLSTLIALTEKQRAPVFLSYRQRGPGEERFFTDAKVAGFTIEQVSQSNGAGGAMDTVYLLQRVGAARYRKASTTNDA